MTTDKDSCSQKSVVTVESLSVHIYDIFTLNNFDDTTQLDVKHAECQYFLIIDENFSPIATY